MKYGLYASLTALAVLSVMYFLAVGEVADLKLQAETDKFKQQEQITKKLAAQDAAHAEAIKTERFRSAAREKYDRQTLTIAQQEADHANRVSRSLFVVINRMLDHARGEFVALPSGAIGPARDTAAAGSVTVRERDQYTDAQTALEDYGKWCEGGWNRVRSIASVQEAACSAH